MHVLIRGLPPTALVRTPVNDRVRDPWTVSHELLAQVVEMVSIGAANHTIKKPVRIPRPGRQQPPRQVRTVSVAPGQSAASGAIAMLAGAQPHRIRALTAVPDLTDDDGATDQ